MLAPQAEQSWAERIWWTIAGIAMLNFAIGLYGSASTFPWIAMIVVIGGLWSLGTITVSLIQFGQAPQIRKYANVLGWITAGLLLLLFAAWAFVQVHNAPAYGTDELAFDQYAAQLFQHGLNPYLHSMSPSFHLFRVSPDGATYTLTGQAVTQFSYPSLAFLVYVPFLLLGWSHELGVGINLIAWVFSVALMFWMLPRNMRAAALVIGLVDAYISNAVGGVTDVLYMPLLIIAAYRWDRFDAADRRSYVAPVMVGLAMSIKQTPWPLLVFVLAALACDEYARGGIGSALRRAGRYLAIAAATFFAVNLPFILMSPSGWVSGTLTPLFKDMVPSGQGTVALSLFLHLGGGSLFAFTVATAFMAILTLVAYVGTYPLMRPATFILPALIYFFAARSQTNYLIALIPVAVIGAVTAGPAVQAPPSSELDGALLEAGLTGRGWRAWLAWIVGPTGPVRSLRWAQAIAVSALLFALATFYSVTAPSPLTLTITGVKVNGILGVVQEATVRVTNTSYSRVTPSFTAQDGHGFTTFWQVATGPRVLAPGQSAKYSLFAPNSGAEPSLGGGFTLVAFNKSPGSVSVSNRYLPELKHLTFNPQAFNSAVPVGKTVILRVQLVGHLNQTADESGVPVHLGQTIFTGTGHARSTVIINGSKPGKRNVIALTNSQGVATFKIVATKRSRPLPTSFTAYLVDASADYQYGVTGTLVMRFIAPRP
jgi:hypothetical protein